MRPAPAAARSRRYGCATPSARLTIEDVATSNGEGPGRHQRPLHLVLDRFDGGDDFPFIDAGKRSQDRGDDGVNLSGSHRGDGIGKGDAELSADRHLDRVGDTRAVKGRHAAVPLADHVAVEAGRLIPAFVRIAGPDAFPFA